ncbi:MAG: hypothetical protein ABIJ39_04325 [Chloroflexota bacterium]
MSRDELINLVLAEHAQLKTLRADYNALKQTANGVLHSGHVELAKRVFPAGIVKPDGVLLRRPAKWR